MNNDAQLKSFRRQRGVALITAVLIVSLVTVATVAMMERQTYDMRRTENILHWGQVYMYALGGEVLVAQEILLKDKDMNVDGVEDEWLNTPMPVPMDIKEGAIEGTISGQIRDINARFPLNNIVNPDGTVNADYRDGFGKLVAYVANKSKTQKALNPGEEPDPYACQGQFAQPMEDVVADWIDTNVDVAPGGAEDLDYLGKERPYRTANQPMVSVSELRLMSNVIAEDYNCLVPKGNGVPLINALPVKEMKININTAPHEVLVSISKEITDNVAAKIIEKRAEESYKDVNALFEDLKNQIEWEKYIDDIKQDPKQNENKNPNPQAQNTAANQQQQLIQQAQEQFKNKLNKMISTKSDYFELTSLTQIGKIAINMISILKRENNKVTVVQRTMGQY